MSNNADRVEVFAGIQRRRRYTAEQKMAFVQEAAQPGMTISYVARRHGIAPSLIFGWRRRMSEGGKEAIRADDDVVSKAEILSLQKQIRELQRVLGKKTLENEILREAVNLSAVFNPRPVRLDRGNSTCFLPTPSFANIPKGLSYETFTVNNESGLA